MNRPAFVPWTAGLLLLAIAAWLAAFPRPNPRPDLPEIAPFAAGDRIALFLPDPGVFPPPGSFGLVQRARAAGAEVRVFASGDSADGFGPTRIYRVHGAPDLPAGYHPDQWPRPPAKGNDFGQDWQMLVLTPAEIAVKQQAVLASAGVLRDSGTDDPTGSRELAILSRARRAEVYYPLTP